MIVEINPIGTMDLLSQLEVDKLKQSSTSELYRLYRNCSLAVLNVGSHTDNSDEIYEQFKDFDINLIPRERGVKIQLINPPSHAFVDGELITGIKELLFDVLRDILFTGIRLKDLSKIDLEHPTHITHYVFDILRNAGALQAHKDPNMIVCWGGHSIKEHEYQYTKDVGYQLGLRGLNICTGCGPGAMKGPMKGATIAHLKQRISSGRYLGLTEPSIIAAEPPNPIVNELVILPDIEKRLEAFLRVAHGIVIFPGGVGTAEELLYILGIMLNQANKSQCLPIVLTGPKESADYFVEIDQFVKATLGQEAADLYTIIVDDPAAVARHMKDNMANVRAHRRETGDAYHFNWSLKIEPDFQQPFAPTHNNVAELNLNLAQDKALLAANLRRTFSAIVAGNVKEEGIREIKQHGPFTINGEPQLMTMIDNLLKAFVEQGRMKLPGTTYKPCYQIEQK
ncbi:nucleotide 5'-monophosphate nucleosidase PpnN [Catenovulum sp. 2E275]|uniref:nucleotide 5'-monophosphate nucleosidase PpnN n=1 Tax=Catenovulum sp. 2E275 TaxID=2980497 RepID=UPI0021D3BE13|nr:nucleotide 5'-monophosphate nucleosidase PpnN [Catenovulum sp. 2E275]MCU4676083.1 nucleotide 5'-monophosphate nucleosidase PpnN [Catenovulum sp. 2E275]